MKKHFSLMIFLKATFAAIFIAFCYSAWDFVIVRHFGMFPRVSDTAALRSDCRNLLSTYPVSTKVYAKDWPASIARLHPKAVSINKDSVDIFISSGGIGSSYGVLVFPSSSSDTTLSEYFITKRYSDGIFFWQSQT